MKKVISYILCSIVMITSIICINIGEVSAKQQTIAGGGGGVAGTSVIRVSNMSGFFKTGFGKSIQGSVTKTSKMYQSQSVYKATKNTTNPNIKKNDQFYLDNKHKDHLEVFDKNGKFKKVLNLDGTVNSSKTKNAAGRTLK